MKACDETSLTILLFAQEDDRLTHLRSLLSMLLPDAAVVASAASTALEGSLPRGDAVIVDAGPVVRGSAELLRVLRARGFAGPILVITPVCDDPSLTDVLAPLGIESVARKTVDASPSELASILTTALGAEASVATALRQARRVFAAGQAALSLQHAINNPLAALMAEAQLLQLEELNSEQRASVERMVELCRRLVGLVRRLDALADNGT